MSTWTGESKASSTWTGESKNVGGLGYLLMETGDFLLQESLDKIILEQTSAGGLVWTGENKS